MNCMYHIDEAMKLMIEAERLLRFSSLKFSPSCGRACWERQCFYDSMNVEAGVLSKTFDGTF